jgi:hypothetical protein
MARDLLDSRWKTPGAVTFPDFLGLIASEGLDHRSEAF